MSRTGRVGWWVGGVAGLMVLYLVVAPWDVRREARKARAAEVEGVEV